jgi:cardiolipin synthase
LQLIYLPNFITVFRLFLVPVIVWAIVAKAFLGAFIVFVVAGVTDALDGFLARRFGWRTELGAYLDPVADKALLMSVYATLGFFGYLPAWLVILVISRDVLIIGAVLLAWLLGRTVALRPVMVSKVNTTMQIALAVLILAETGLQLGWDAYMPLFVWATGLTTAASAAVYLVIWLKRMAYYDLDEHRKRVETASGRAHETFERSDR